MKCSSDAYNKFTNTRQLNSELYFLSVFLRYPPYLGAFPYPPPGEAPDGRPVTPLQKLLVFERKILRGIFGHTKENQTWRIKNNEELDKLIKHGNIVNHIIAQRLSWLGHMQRMAEARAAKKIFKWNPLTTRPRGRPKHRWEDIIEDLGQMKIKNWLTCVQDRAKWKDVVEKTKTSN